MYAAEQSVSDNNYIAAVLRKLDNSEQYIDVRAVSCIIMC